MTNDKSNNSIFGDIGDDQEFREHYGEQIGCGISAVIYARDGIVAKVFREGQLKTQMYAEAFTLAMVESLGIPAPKVYGVEMFAGRMAVLMDQVKGDSLLDLMIKNQEKIGEYLDMVVKLQKEMHMVESWSFRPLRMLLKTNISASPGLSPEEKNRLSAMLIKLPDEFYLCHGDFHGGNILYDGESFKIIDWAEVCSGSPSADACRTYLDYHMFDNTVAELYLGKYCDVSGRSREEILTWLPVVAGAVYGYLPDEAKKIIRPLF
jgi:tRNA A-37 threonylcarbamoyl transferase component Bud32